MNQTDNMHVLVINRGTAYLSKKQLAQELNYSEQTIANYIKGIQEEIERGRYSKYAVAGNRYNYYVMVDYMKYKDVLKDENMRKYVPDFNPAEIAELCGYNQKFISAEG